MYAFASDLFWVRFVQTPPRFCSFKLQLSSNALIRDSMPEASLSIPCLYQMCDPSQSEELPKQSVRNV